MNPEFKKWLKQLDKLFINTIGLDHNDVEDHDWHSEWVSDISPSEAFQEWYATNWGEYL